MNAIASADAVESLPRLDIPPAPPERPVEWLRAVRALRALLNDPEQTEKALEGYKRFRALGCAQGTRGFPRRDCPTR